MSGSRTRADGLRVGAAALCLVIAGGLAGCGRQGQLEQPGPLFGSRAKADYQQRRAEKAAAARSRAAEQGRASGSAERTDQEPPGADNAPRSTRDLQDPNQQDVPASRAPIPGSAPDPFGPQPSLRPPGA